MTNEIKIVFLIPVVILIYHVKPIIFQESLLGMLCQVFTGKSFELILAVATVEGKLCTLVSKLINLNECCKQGIDESNKTLAMLFDITFLMLCYITQTFGSEVRNNKISY